MIKYFTQIKNNDYQTIGDSHFLKKKKDCWVIEKKTSSAINNFEYHILLVTYTDFMQLKISKNTRKRK